MKCPICKHLLSHENTFKVLDFKQCTNCLALFGSKHPKVVYSEKYFEEKNKPSPLSFVLSPLLDFFYYLRVKQITQIVNNANVKILDYGCGSGKLVAKLNEFGYSTIGYEPSVGARNITNRQHIPVYGKINVSLRSLDLVMFWHSLEHTENPGEVIKKIKPLLKNKGKLLIAVPNIDTWEFKIAKDKWFHYSFPLHLTHFTPKAMTMMLNNNGFEVQDIDFFNPEYTISSLVQTFLNLLLPKDVLYSVVAHRRSELSLLKSNLIAMASISLIILFSPIFFIFYISQLTLKKTSAMVVVAWKKK